MYDADPSFLSSSLCLAHIRKWLLPALLCFTAKRNSRSSCIGVSPDMLQPRSDLFNRCSFPSQKCRTLIQDAKEEEVFKHPGLRSIQGIILLLKVNTESEHQTKEGVNFSAEGLLTFWTTVPFQMLHTRECLHYGHR